MQGPDLARRPPPPPLHPRPSRLAQGLVALDDPGTMAMASSMMTTWFAVQRTAPPQEAPAAAQRTPVAFFATWCGCGAAPAPDAAHSTWARFGCAATRVEPGLVAARREPLASRSTICNPASRHPRARRLDLWGLVAGGADVGALAREHPLIWTHRWARAQGRPACKSLSSPQSCLPPPQHRAVDRAGRAWCKRPHLSPSHQ